LFLIPDLDFDLMWKIGVLKSSRRLLIPDNFYEHVANVIQNVGRNVVQYVDRTVDRNVGRNVVQNVGRTVVEKALDYIDSCTNGDVSFMADVQSIFDSVVADLVEIVGNLNEVCF
jgi:hypothetical protein